MHQEIVDMINNVYETTTTGWRYKSNRRYHSNDEVMASISRQLSNAGKFNLMGEVVDIPAWLDENKLQPEPASQNTFVTPEDFINMVVLNKKISISKNGTRITRQLGADMEKDMNPDDFLLILKNELIDFNRTRERDERLKESDIETKMYYSLLQAGHSHLLEVGKKLYYDVNCIPVLDTWLEGMHKLFKIKEPIGVWKMMVTHMVWLIKRQMFSRKVINDIWLQIFGYQGTGKTFVARNVLFGVLSEFYVETEVSKIEDFDREIEKFTKYLIVNFDEVALGNTGDPQHKLGKKMMNNLKSLLTRELFTVRTMRTQKQAVLRKTFTAFSSANTHLYDVIFDETGMRRFFEFTSEQPFDTQYNHAEVAKLTALSEQAWKGVNEDNDNGYWIKTSEEGIYVQTAQQSYFPTYSTVRMWVTEAKVVAGETILDDAYADYQQYCRTSGNSYIDTKQKFISDMRIVCKDFIDAKGSLRISYEG